MPTVPKSPGQPWPRAARGLEIILEDGIHQPVEFDAATDMVIQGCEGAVIEGSKEIGGGEPPCSMRFHDGCHRLQILGPLEVRQSVGRGIRITVADDIQLADLFVHHNGIEGIITGNCRRGSYTNLTIEDSRDSPDASVRREYTPDKRHGIYISGNADGSVVQGLNASRVTGSGLQMNGAGMDEVIVGATATQLVFTRCGSGGTPPISMMACQQCEITDFCEDWVAGDKAAVMFADGKGQQYACVGNRFERYTVPRGARFSEEQGSRDNSWDPKDGWSPDQPPEPVPPDPSPPDVQADLDAIDQALAAIVAEVNTAQAALARVESALSGGGT